MFIMFNVQCSMFTMFKMFNVQCSQCFKWHNVHNHRLVILVLQNTKGEVRNTKYNMNINTIAKVCRPQYNVDKQQPRAVGDSNPLESGIVRTI